MVREFKAPSAALLRLSLSLLGLALPLLVGSFCSKSFASRSPDPRSLLEVRVYRPT